MNSEEKELLRSLGIDESALLEAPQSDADSSRSVKWTKNGLVVAGVTTAVGAALAVNVAMLLSLPSVVRGRGAPYLPSRVSTMDSMFQWLKQQPDIRSNILLQQADGHLRRLPKTTTTAAAPAAAAAASGRQYDDNDRRLKFVDLGSGDGRWVFRAASQHSDLFHTAVGYEINPLLHLFAMARRAFLSLFRRRQRRATGDERLPYCATELHCQDLWTVSLHDANVVAVYGLGPIMKELGAKLERELPPGSYVLSNVFSVPGWEPVVTSRSSTTTTAVAAGSTTYYIYKMPQRAPVPTPAKSS